MSYGVWITLNYPNGRGRTTVRARDLSKPNGEILTFDTEPAAADYAEKRRKWYARRQEWCEVATGPVP